MANVQQGPVVHSKEAAAGGAPGGAPEVSAAETHPPSRVPETGAPSGNPQSLERKSVAETAGAEASLKASTVVLSPGEPGPHIRAPETAGMPMQEGSGGGGVKQKLKEVWQEVKEITPGTKEHRQEYGTDTALGGYRSQLGKR